MAVQCGIEPEIYIYIYTHTCASYDIQTSYILTTRCTYLCCMIFSPNIDCFDIQL